MTRPTANDYAAALAALSDYHFEGVAPEAALFGAMLTYVRARLAADEANERYIELAKAELAGTATPDRSTWDNLNAECDRLYAAADAAYSALVALAAGAAEVAP